MQLCKNIRSKTKTKLHPKPRSLPSPPSPPTPSHPPPHPLPPPHQTLTFTLSLKKAKKINFFLGGGVPPLPLPPFNPPPQTQTLTLSLKEEKEFQLSYPFIFCSIYCSRNDYGQRKSRAKILPTSTESEKTKATKLH